VKMMASAYGNGGGGFSSPMVAGSSITKIKDQRGKHFGFDNNNRSGMHTLGISRRHVSTVLAG
jgi:hypothetical protein